MAGKSFSFDTGIDLGPWLTKSLIEAVTPKSIRKQSQEQEALAKLAEYAPWISKLPESEKADAYNRIFQAHGVYRAPWIRGLFGAGDEPILPLPEGTREERRYVKGPLGIGGGFQKQIITPKVSKPLSFPTPRIKPLPSKEEVSEFETFAEGLGVPKVQVGAAARKQYGLPSTPEEEASETVNKAIAIHKLITQQPKEAQRALQQLLGIKEDRAILVASGLELYARLTQGGMKAEEAINLIPPTIREDVAEALTKIGKLTPEVKPQTGFGKWLVERYKKDVTSLTPPELVQYKNEYLKESGEEAKAKHIPAEVKEPTIPTGVDKPLRESLLRLYINSAEVWIDETQRQAALNLAQDPYTKPEQIYALLSPTQKQTFEQIIIQAEKYTKTHGVSGAINRALNELQRTSPEKFKRSGGKGEVTTPPAVREKSTPPTIIIYDKQGNRVQ